ncbi:hypothetical protein QLS71_002420 [Mariniflexile litorale]|uniref:Uncharacterized protein n=1 Tax=Mariniflexile litorale TaxID=3045158 RepID=A0AAU7EID5_9FLAO|nr:hypothetical protein [Mariniflexile sp. KMM 9835]MDQ8210674.1 hypothetical protein [Mariniflexile sp. KMM 9835]
MGNIQTSYILAANSKAMELIKISTEALTESNCYDFMVFRFSDWEEILKDLEAWEDFVPINESTYNILHTNLCIKLREFIKYL